MKSIFKKILTSVLIALIILAPAGALSGLDIPAPLDVKATALTDGDYAYEIRDSYAAIIGYKGSSSSIIIPSELGGYIVSTIDQGVFADKSFIEFVMLPDTLIKIGAASTAFKGVFENCTKLKTVIMRTGTFDAVLGPETFMNCKSLESIVIPGNYSVISENAFFGCTALESVTYKKSDYAFANQTIEAGAFRNCTALTKISLPSTLNSIGAYAFYGITVDELKIPEGVTDISYGAFAESPNLISVTFPTTLKNIGASNVAFMGAFENCPKLQKVTFRTGTSDAVIGSETFMNCRSLQSVSIPGNYTTIRENAFSGCTALKSVTLTKSNYGYANQVIENNAFRDCTALKRISLPTTLKTIEANAFAGSAVEELEIPEGVTSIGYGAFSGSYNLRSVTLPSTLTNIGAANTAFTGAFEGCQKLEKVVFAEGNKKLTIGAEAFMNCTSLETVHLPLNLTEIKQNAFNYSTKSLTLCSKSEDSYAKEYADTNAINFELCDGKHTASAGLGDVNNDKDINSTDALLVLQHSVGKKTLYGDPFLAADTTRDGTVNSSDALVILQYSVGKITEI